MKAILDGQPTKVAAHRYGVSHQQAKQWCRLFQAGGWEAVFKTYQHYTADFKWQAIQYRWTHGLSYSQAVAHLGIPGQGQVQVWEQLYIHQGFEGLQDTRKGRPPSMAKTKKPKKSDRPLTREEELEQENERLRMENDYLKKIECLNCEAEKVRKEDKVRVVSELRLIYPLDALLSLAGIARSTFYAILST